MQTNREDITNYSGSYTSCHIPMINYDAIIWLITECLFAMFFCWQCSTLLVEIFLAPAGCYMHNYSKQLKLCWRCSVANARAVKSG